MLLPSIVIAHHPGTCNSDHKQELMVLITSSLCICPKKWFETTDLEFWWCFDVVMISINRWNTIPNAAWGSIKPFTAQIASLLFLVDDIDTSPAHNGIKQKSMPKQDPPAPYGTVDTEFWWLTCTTQRSASTEIIQQPKIMSYVQNELVKWCIWHLGTKPLIISIGA